VQSRALKFKGSNAQTESRTRISWTFSVSVLGPDFLLNTLFSENLSPFSSVNVLTELVTKFVEIGV
jgi:hypothetical protein